MTAVKFKSILLKILKRNLILIFFESGKVIRLNNKQFYIKEGVKNKKIIKNYTNKDIEF